MTTGVETVLEVLVAADFERLQRPLVVAGSTFDFDAAVKGTGVSHDLVVVASSISSRRLVRLVSGLSRTLDQVESRRPVTLVLVGAPPDGPTMADLERHARVLNVETEAPDPDQVRRAVAVLLPLSIPSATERGSDPLTEVSGLLGKAMSEEHQFLIDSAKVGPDEVRESLRQFIDEAARGDQSEVAETWSI